LAFSWLGQMWWNRFGLMFIGDIRRQRVSVETPGRADQTRRWSHNFRSAVRCDAKAKSIRWIVRNMASLSKTRGQQQQVCAFLMAVSLQQWSKTRQSAMARKYHSIRSEMRLTNDQYQ
jgi:hypothetical protein